MKEAIKCKECGNFFDKNLGLCPFCGTVLTVEDDSRFLESNYTIHEADYSDDVKTNEITQTNTTIKTIDKKSIIGEIIPPTEVEGFDKKEVIRLYEQYINYRKQDLLDVLYFDDFTAEAKTAAKYALKNFTIDKGYEAKFLNEVLKRQSLEAKISAMEHKGSSGNTNVTVLHNFSTGKMVAIIITIIILIAGIAYLSSLKRCSKCNKLFDEGYTALGNYYCEDCFYD